MYLRVRGFDHKDKDGDKSNNHISNCRLYVQIVIFLKQVDRKNKKYCLLLL